MLQQRLWRSMQLDARGIEAFFSVVGRTVSEAELRYYLHILGQDLPLGRSLSFVAGPSQSQYAQASRKWRRAIWIARVLRIFPWIRGVAIANSLAMGSVKEESDIDLFILCTPRRVWLARFVVVALLRVLRLRPGEATRDPVCPSFFVTPEAYDLQTIAIEDDVYLRFWLATLAPVWEVDGEFTRFFAANTWAVRRDVAVLVGPPSVGVRCARSVLNVVSSGHLDQWMRRLQMRILPQLIREKALRDDRGVILTDSMLKFHEEDGRVTYRDAWKKALC